MEGEKDPDGVPWWVKAIFKRETPRTLVVKFVIGIGCAIAIAEGHFPLDSVYAVVLIIAVVVGLYYEEMEKKRRVVITQIDFLES